MYFFMTQQLLVARVSSLSRINDHTLKDSSERVIAPSQGHLPDNTQHSKYTDILALSGIRTRNPSEQEAADTRLISRGDWDQ